MEQRDPAVCSFSFNQEGKDEMTKASINLQDLRRRIYVKAKAETTWRFWGLYVHVCKMETLSEAFRKHTRSQGPSLCRQRGDEACGDAWPGIPGQIGTDHLRRHGDGVDAKSEYGQSKRQSSPLLRHALGWRVGRSPAADVGAPRLNQACSNRCTFARSAWIAATDCTCYKIGYCARP